jgi:hypothetical protein
VVANTHNVSPQLLSFVFVLGNKSNRVIPLDRCAIREHQDVPVNQRFPDRLQNGQEISKNAGKENDRTDYGYTPYCSQNELFITIFNTRYLRHLSVTLGWTQTPVQTGRESS